MQINQIEIDNSLIENAVKVSGLYNKKALIEKALLLFTQQEIKSVYQGKVLSLEEMEQAIECKNHSAYRSYVEDRQQWQKDYSGDGIFGEMENLK